MEVARTLRNDREKMGEHPMYRPSRGHGQSQPQQAVAQSRIRRSEDPLAELARLIGQEDPFREFDTLQPRRAPVNGNGAGHAPAVAPERRPDRQANGHGNGAGYDNGSRPAQARTAAYEAPRPADRYAQPAAPAPARAPIARTDERYPAPRPVRPVLPEAQARAAAPAARYDEVQRPATRQGARDTSGQYADRPVRSRSVGADTYADDMRPARQAPEQRARRPEPQPASRYVPEEAPRHARSRPQQAPYQDAYQRGYENDYDPEYDDDAYLPDHAEDIYDDVQRPRRGLGFWLVAAIVVASLIAVGFLGIFAYRTIFNTPQRAAIVTKSPAPVKVEPKNTPQTAVPQSNKPIQDRVGGAEQPNSQIMRREEAPVDLTQQRPNLQPQQPAFGPQQQQQPPQVQRAPQFTPPAQQQQQQPPQNVDQQPKRVKSVPLRSDGPVQQPGPQSENNTPVQLAPNTQAQQQAPRSTVASLGPATAPASGNYVVQVASHKTPEEAQNAWNNLRQQYGSIFGNRNADIRKVDLGDRGTFYRAMVGPMNREQANALCQNLKTQGAGCIVQTR